MLTFTNLTLIPGYPNKLAVQWELNNEWLPVHYTFDVDTSNNPTGPWQRSNALSLLDTYYYELPAELTFKDELLYVRVTASVPGATATSDAASLTVNLHRHDYLLVKEMIRKKLLLRHKFVGNPCRVYKRRNFGAPCTRCLDAYTGQVTDSKCGVCYGTRFIGGFFTPALVEVEIVEGPRQVKPSEIGSINNIVSTGNLYYPLLTTGDIIAEVARNKRWYVVGAQREALRTYPFDQQCELRLLAPKDIEYSLPI